MGRTRRAHKPGLSNPVPDAEFGRIDQGVDYLSRRPVRALASGRIVSHDKGMAGGTGDIIRERFDRPVRVRGRTYYGGYYSERPPLVGVGARVRAGQKVMDPGSNEIGFLEGQDLQMPPLIGGLGAGTKPTQAGSDYAALVNELGGPASPTATPPPDGGGGTGSTGGSGGGSGGGGRSHGPPVTSPLGDISAIAGDVGVPLVDSWTANLAGGGIFGTLSDVTDFLKAALWLINPRNWLRLFEIAVGGLLMLLGLVGLGVILVSRSELVQEAAGAAQLAPGPLGAAGRIATTAGMARRSSQTRRRLVAETIPQQAAERAATQQGEREERRSQRNQAVAAARASGRRRVQAARDRHSAERFGKVPF